MKTTIVTGMLGAGKTSFILNHLKHAVEKTVVLVNDFGRAGVDGEIISQRNTDTIELPSGCVCCTLRYDLLTTLQRIMNELQPEHLLIEPSGIASPSAVLEALHESGITRYAVVTLVDPVEFLETHDSGMYGAFFEDQIRNADMVLLNKTDIARPEVVERTWEIVHEMNPFAVVFKTSYGRIDTPLKMHNHEQPLKREGHIHLETITLNIPQGASYEGIKRLFHRILSGSFGKVLRAKGLVQTDSGPYRFDYTSKRLNIEFFSSHISRSRIVIIGNGLDASAIETSL